MAFDPNKFNVTTEDPAEPASGFDPNKFNQVSTSGFNPDRFNAGVSSGVAQTNHKQLSKEEKEKFEEESAVKELFTGVQRAVAPSTVDVKGRDHFSGAEMAGELATTIAGGVAAAKTGAVIGAAVSGPAAPLGATIGAVAGGIAWGLYTGLGQHLLREKEIAYDKGDKEGAKKMTMVEAFEKNPQSALLEIASNVNPALTSASKTMRVVRAVGQVAIETAKEANYEDSSKASAAVSGALAIIPGALIMVPRTDTPSLKALKKLQSNAKVGAEGVAEMPMSVQQKVMGEILEAQKTSLDTNDIDFQHWFVRMAGDSTDGNVENKFKTHSARYNDDKMKDMWGAFKAQEILTKEAQNQVHLIHAEMARMGTKGATYGSASGNFIPPRFLARQLDRTFNLNLATDIDKVSEGSSITAFLVNKHGRDIAKAAKARKKLGVSGEEFMIALEAGIEKLKAGSVSDLSESTRKKLLSEEGIDTLTRYRDKFDELHKYWESNGYKVGFLQNYVPMYSMRGADAATAIRRRYDLFKQNKLSSEEVSEFFSAMAQVTGDSSFLKKAGDPKWKPSANDIYTKYEQTIADLLESQGRGKQAIQLTAAMEREGKVPSWLREKDIDKVLQGYVAHNIKSVEMGDVLLRLRMKADILQEVGMDNAAGDIRKYISDQLGPDNTVWWNSFVKRNKFIAEELLENQDSSTWDKTKAYGRLALPEVISFLHTSYYSGALGLNVRSHVRNLAQSYFTTAPELQGTYGYSVVTRGFLDLAKDIKNIKGTLEEVNNLGLNGGLVREFERDINNLSKFKKVNQQLNDVLMASYSLTDGINRAGTLRTARIVADDLMNNNKGAWSWIEKLNRRDPGRASLLRELIQKGDKKALGEAIASDLVAKTQFHYGRTQLSSMQRSLGKLTSMFTTWPTNTVGEIYDSFQGSGSVGKTVQDNWHRFVAPLGFVMAANYLFDQTAPDSAKKVKKYALGNPLELGQLYAVSDLSFINNPILQFGGKFADQFFDFTKTFADGDKGTTGDSLDKLLDTTGKQIVRYHLPVFSSFYNEARRVDKAFGNDSKMKKKKK